MIERGERIDRVTVANELMRFNELESCDGLSYLVSLDDGLPQTVNIDGYIRIVKDKAVLRRIIFASQHLMNRCLIGEEEPDEILAGAEETLLKLGEDRVRNGLVSPRQVIDEYQGGLNAFLDPSKRVKGISTGFTKLDEKTSGLHAGDLFILAARPSMGKTALALNIAENVAVRHREPVAVFSLEMSKESLLLRLLASHARVDAHKFRTGHMNRDDWTKVTASLAELGDAPIWIDDSASSTVLEMGAKARRLKRDRGLSLVIVDYIQLVVPSTNRRNANRQEEVSSISRSLKALAKELKVPVVVLSQLTRAPEREDRKPQLSDLRESGAIEQDADVVMFINRPNFYKTDIPEEERAKAELIIAKQRNGPTGSLNFVFLSRHTRFEEAAPDAWSSGGDE